MKRKLGRAVLWIWTTFAMAAMAFAAVQAQLPEGEGKKILEAKCTLCHDLGLVTDKRATKEGWADTVELMKSSGAELTDAEATTLVDYLAANLGPAGADAAPAPGGLPAGDGKQIVENACTQCHGLDYITEAKYNKEQWTDVVDRMKLSGAPVEDSQVGVLVDYLTKSFGPNE